MNFLSKKVTISLIIGMFSLNNAYSHDNVYVDTSRGIVSVKENPKKVAVFNLSALDTIDALGVKVGATITNVYNSSYLKKAAKGATVVGAIKNPNIEALHAYNPDLIVLGLRTAGKYNDVKKVFPSTIDVTLRNSDLINDGLNKLAEYGEIFGKTEKAIEIKHNVRGLLQKVQNSARNKGKGLIVLVSGNKISAFGSKSIFGWIHNSVGIKEADKDIKTASHGQPISFEYIRKINPDWLFVLDRSLAIGEKGKSAKSILDNALVQRTTAWKNNQVVYLSSESYLAPGGVRQIQKDLKSIEKAFSK